jgi:hypothetical protein
MSIGDLNPHQLDDQGVVAMERKEFSEVVQGGQTLTTLARSSVTMALILTLAMLASLIPATAVQAAPASPATSAAEVDIVDPPFQRAAPQVVGDEASIRAGGTWRCLTLWLPRAMVCAFMVGWKIGSVYASIPWVQNRMRARLDRCWPNCSWVDFLRATVGI